MEECEKPASAKVQESQREHPVARSDIIGGCSRGIFLGIEGEQEWSTDKQTEQRDEKPLKKNLKCVFVENNNIKAHISLVIHWSFEREIYNASFLSLHAFDLQ